MKIKQKLVGTLVDVKKTKAGKSYGKVYADGSIHNVFDISEGLISQLGKVVTIEVEGYAKDVYLKQVF